MNPAMMVQTALVVPRGVSGGKHGSSGHVFPRYPYHFESKNISPAYDLTTDTNGRTRRHRLQSSRSRILCHDGKRI